ncbi:uncharacterized protein LOC134239217 isoform X2 [Saccostrea cucullata]|uniref:uncharacterized protein LOC134239217 isoform X2 n=1 Tax=Saccostrea cuccullata TaxID=36930 RepID=UPI002ED1735B
MSMKGRTIKAILNEAKKGTSADSSRIGRAEAILTQLKKDADWLQANNSPLYTKIKSDIDRKTSYSRPEVTKDSDDLCRFLATQKSADSNVWKNYVFLLECRNHKRESSATKLSTTSPIQGQSRISSFQSPNTRQSPSQSYAYNKGSRQNVRSQTIENGEVQQQKPPSTNEILNNKLMEENEKLKESVNQQKQQIEELTTRLSRYASQQLTQGNPNIADLSDKNRPTKIGEKFALVYDDQWSEAFEALKVGGKTEETVVTELANLVRECYKFSDETKDKMRNELMKRTAEVIRNPLQSSLSITEEPKDVQLTGSNAIFNDLLKKNGEQSVKCLKMAFRKQKESYTRDKRLTDYLDILVELTWNMVLQDPPMALNFAKNGDKIDEKSFKHYSKKGNVVLLCVWPALHLYNGGPIVSKGFTLPQ